MSLAESVPTFDPCKDRRCEVDSGMPVLAVEEFSLQGGPEGFDECVVEAGSNACHSFQQAGCSQPVTENPRGVLRASVRVNDGAGW